MESWYPYKPSLRASHTVSVELNFPVELKFPVELNSFSDASRVCEPANESLFSVTCRFRKYTELSSLVNKQSIVLRSHFALRQRHIAIRMKQKPHEVLHKTIDWLLIYENSFVFFRLSFASSQTLLASENEFNPTGNFNSTVTIRDALD